MDLSVYTCHQTPEETEGRTKYHVTNEAEGKALCGFVGKYFGAAPLSEVDMIWLNQIDPDNWVCKHCRKAAKKLLAQNEH